ncbi:unnamed protein product [Candida verbasci]|uniref:F-box protein HRT3 n=1 Tax=Candida verbasci TaxID=1227364 RepID=A0A9W4XMG5_9ASCO|nr:unnamed protein product [Candida verbasci]
MSLVATDTSLDVDHKAIQLFEKAIEKESQGLMSEAIQFYRQAFKLNEQVDSLYRSIHLPKAINQYKSERGKNAMHNVDDSKVAEINVDKLIQSFEHIDANPPNPEDELSIKISNLELNAKLISPLVHLPNDIWIYILEILVHISPESWFRMSITCKKFAYLGFNNSIWREICNLVYPRQIYEENKYRKLNDSDDDLPIPKNQLKIIPQYKSWKLMLNQRPFIKFLGCYISVINYYSEGGKSEFSSSWSNPVRTITYYRYMRFYPDGTVLKVLSVLPPDQIVPYLHKSNKSVPNIIEDKPVFTHDVKESHKIYKGKWSVSADGEVSIIIENGSVPYYTFHYNFQIKSLGGIKHGKLSWIKYYAIRKQINEQDDDDRIGEISEFSIRNEKPFKFSRVRSYILE